MTEFSGEHAVNVVTGVSADFLASLGINATVTKGVQFAMDGVINTGTQVGNLVNGMAQGALEMINKNSTLLANAKAGIEDTAKAATAGMGQVAQTTMGLA